MRFITKHKAYILGVYALLLLIHFVLKDNIFPISIIFYATPLILIIAFGFITTFLFYKKKIIFFSLFFLSLFLSFNWLSNYYMISITNKLPLKDTSILFWNTAKNPQGFPTEIITNKTKNHDIDIFALVETKKISDTNKTRLQNTLTNYSFKSLQGNMFFGAKGQIELVNYKHEEKSYTFNHLLVALNKQKTSILIVDIYASPFLSKEKSLNTIISYAETNKIDIIVGDFNTPYESIHFQEFKTNYTSFHNYGNEFTATWPYGMPLLELDQVWTNSKKAIPTALKKHQNNFSDHKMLIANYRTRSSLDLP